jgi:hypothetical protein
MSEEVLYMHALHQGVMGLQEAIADFLLFWQRRTHRHTKVTLLKVA